MPERLSRLSSYKAISVLHLVGRPLTTGKSRLKYLKTLLTARQALHKIVSRRVWNFSLTSESSRFNLDFSSHLEVFGQTVWSRKGSNAN